MLNTCSLESDISENEQRVVRGPANRGVILIAGGFSDGLEWKAHRHLLRDKFRVAPELCRNAGATLISGDVFLVCRRYLVLWEGVSHNYTLRARLSAGAVHGRRPAPQTVNADN
jgi:hypothetical protein